MHTGFWCGDLKERDHYEYLSVDGRKILNWILKKWFGRARSGLIWFLIGKNLLCDYGNESSDYSIKLCNLLIRCVTERV
jgi:hypothetical protein